MINSYIRKVRINLAIHNVRQMQEKYYACSEKYPKF